MKNSMSEALKRRKMNALDLTIVFDPGVLGMEKEEENGEKEEEKLGLAPDAEKLGGEENPGDEMADGGEVSGEVATTPNDSSLMAGRVNPSHADEKEDKALIEQELMKLGVGKSKFRRK